MKRMPLPAYIRVRLSSEEAGAVSVTPVVVQDMELAALLGLLLEVYGEDSRRIADALKRGSAVRGATRYRWESLEPPRQELAATLDAFPRSEPGRAFDRSACAKAAIHSGPVRFEISVEEGKRKRLFKRRTFWEALLEAVQDPEYVRYVHTDRMDLYSVPLSGDMAERLRGAASLLRSSAIARQVRGVGQGKIDLFVRRTR